MTPHKQTVFATKSSQISGIQRASDIFMRKAIKPFGVLMCAAIVATTAVPATAQDDNTEARLRKAESEIRALQRTVFPGGDGRFFEPQINSGATPTAQTGTSAAPSTTAVTDILARLDALEAQLQSLTGRTEETANSLSLLDTRVAALEAAPVAPPAFGAVPSGAVGGAAATGTGLSASTGSNQGATQSSTAAAAGQPVTGPSPERLAAVQQISKPQTDDPADDEYSYGFRLWNAGLFPEARQQLASYVEQYPNHFRISYGRNLLGRAFLDDGMPEEAASWFLRNYQADRTANRAPDSLLYLAEAMIQLKDTSRACIALSEFGETYPAVATGRLADQYETERRRVTCE